MSLALCPKSFPISCCHLNCYPNLNQSDLGRHYFVSIQIAYNESNVVGFKPFSESGGLCSKSKQKRQIKPSLADLPIAFYIQLATSRYYWRQSVRSSYFIWWCSGTSACSSFKCMLTV